MNVEMKTKIMMKNLGGLEKLAGDSENGNERSEAEDPEVCNFYCPYCLSLSDIL